MTKKQKMPIQERYQYLRQMQPVYQASDRKRRSRMLDAMEATTGLHRKSLIRLLRGPLHRKMRVRKRTAT